MTVCSLTEKYNLFIYCGPLLQPSSWKCNGEPLVWWVDCMLVCEFVW